MMFRQSALILLTATAIALSACAPVGIATGIGATAGMASAREGGIMGAASDTRIRAEISDLWFKYKYDTFSKLNLEVDQGRVLITGVVQNPEDRVEAVRLAWQPKGVKQVINEVRIGKPGGLEWFAKDNWITTNIRAKLIGHKQVQSINYSIISVQGSVYLMGVAQNQAELDRVIRICKQTPNVKEVISYVKMLGEPVSGGAVSSSVSSAPVVSEPMPSYSDMNASSAQPPMPMDTAPVPLTGNSSAPSSIESEVLPP